MWAVLIWDQRERTLIASRDRFGIKPLYFFNTKTKWIFASEVKALFKHPDLHPTPDMAAVNRYLQLNELPEPGKTLLNDVEEVKPGTCLILANGQPRTSRYWRLPYYSRPDMKMHTAVERFRELFSDAVRLRLRSDVSVGTMLSGGLDSTTVIATINSLQAKDAESRTFVGTTIQAFHASFPGEPIDETGKVRELCELLGLDVHNVFPMQEENVEELMSETVYNMDFPFNSSIPLVNTLLMRSAKASGISVVLNGHGADEIFAGYPGVDCPIAAADEFRRLRWGRCMQQLRGMVRVQGHSWKWATALTLKSLMPSVQWRTHSIADKTMFDDLFAQRLQEHIPVRPKSGTNGSVGRTELERTLRRQLFSEILPRWLHMEDRTSMSASVEARQPFLDYRVVEFAFSLDNMLKLNGGVTKAILREAMKNALPPSIVEDKRKYFFPGPDAFWLTKPLASSLRRYLLDGNPVINEFVRPEKLRILVKEMLSGNFRQRRLLWRFYFTERWLRDFCGMGAPGCG